MINVFWRRYLASGGVNFFSKILLHFGVTPRFDAIILERRDVASRIILVFPYYPRMMDYGAVMGSHLLVGGVVDVRLVVRGMGNGGIEVVGDNDLRYPAKEL